MPLDFVDILCYAIAFGIGYTIGKAINNKDDDDYNKPGGGVCA